MRKEPYTVGSFVHVMKRGARGMPIVQDDDDRWRFLLILNHFNDHFHSGNWFRDLLDEKISNTLRRASVWPDKRPLVDIEAFTLMPNHFHLVLKEIEEGGISKFMRKIGVGVANHANSKYNEKGSIFQGPYRLRTISEDSYFRYVGIYIMVKNTLELFPGGLKKANAKFDEAWEWGIHYPFSSLGHFAEVVDSPIITAKSFLKELFPTLADLKGFSRDLIQGRVNPASALRDNELEAF